MDCCCCYNSRSNQIFQASEKQLFIVAISKVYHIKLTDAFCMNIFSVEKGGCARYWPVLFDIIKIHNEFKSKSRAEMSHVLGSG